MKDEKKKSSLITLLRYKLERYQAMGDGVMCQNLNSEIRKLQNTRMSVC